MILRRGSATRERKLRVKDQEESRPGLIRRVAVVQGRPYFREIRRSSSIMNSRASGDVQNLYGHTRGSFFTMLSTSVSSLLGNRVTCSLRRDDCARLAAPVRDLPGVSRRDMKRPRKTIKMTTFLCFFLRRASKLLLRAASAKVHMSNGEVEEKSWYPSRIILYAYSVKIRRSIPRSR